MDACIPPFEAEEDSPVDAEPDTDRHKGSIGNIVSMEAQEKIRNEVQHEIDQIKVACGACRECLGQLRHGRTERDNKNDGREGIQHLLWKGR